jgi:hypothetical protein
MDMIYMIFLYGSSVVKRLVLQCTYAFSGRLSIFGSISDVKKLVLSIKYHIYHIYHIAFL